jgi:hypothetical protein
MVHDFLSRKKKSPSRSLRSPHTIRARPACEDCVVFFLLIPPRKYSAQHYIKFSPTGSGAYLFTIEYFSSSMTHDSTQSHTQPFLYFQREILFFWPLAILANKLLIFIYLYINNGARHIINSLHQHFHRSLLYSSLLFKMSYHKPDL